jgi:hypothetical protein
MLAGVTLARSRHNKQNSTALTREIKEERLGHGEAEIWRERRQELKS